MRILLTGASGKVGSYTLQYLLQRGHAVTTVDVVPLPPTVASSLPKGQAEKHCIVDLSSHTATDQLFEKAGPLDGVIHIGAIPDPKDKDWRWVHNNNTASSYNVLYTAGIKYGIKRISQASSVNATGLSYTRPGMQEFDEFPITEKESYRGVSQLSSPCESRANLGRKMVMLSLNSTSCCILFRIIKVLADLQIL
jgi:nucleoside-diphosphate-sugar epimerase